MRLEEYRRRRDFRRTGEPRGRAARKARAPGGRFVVQRHDARRLHYDFRLELDGVLKSWAVPKGPSLVPGERRLAAETEDHPLEYAEFEGRIPAGEYGAGKVAIWDRGRWQAIGDPHAGLAKGALEFRLAGEKLRGRWRLVRMQPRNERRGRASWLLIKGHDEHKKPAGRRENELQALPCAVRAPLPRALAPQLATLVDEPPDGEGWIHELKLDGYRLIAYVENGRVRLLTRAGHDWTERFAGVAAAFATLPVRAALFDGEAVVLDAHGRSNFQALQQALAGGRGELHLFLFDCLHLDGWDLRECRLDLRKEVLRALFDQVPAGSPLRFSDHQTGGGPAFFAEACRSGVEGIVSKRADAPYRSRRSRAWLKVKCTRRQELVIAGFTEPAGSRTGLGALLLAAHDDGGALRYAGKVGTGFDAATLADLRARLAPLERDEPAVAGAPRARGQHWVEPRLVAEVAFTEWTADGRVRHPSFVGLREDKPASQVRFEHAKPLEAAAPAAGGSRIVQVAGVRLSTPERVYFPESGVTKLELAQYYERMQARVLPGLEGRPLTLVRCPEGREGECFYQKRADRSIPALVPRVVVKEGRAPYAMVNDLPSLIALVQVGVLELHVWGARADRLDRPDILVVDLDPDPSVPWRRVADTALLLRALFDELGLVPFVRSTGGKGLHVVVPLERRTGWDEVKSFAQALVAQIVRTAPGEYTARMSKAQRHGKIFLDVFRNAPEATAIASWSVRARPGAPVAAPLAWERLGADERPVLSLRDALATLSEPDPWAAFEASRRPLTAAMRRRVGADA
jgi:bifunctional non-homologous end joining protein LigD